MKRATVDDGEFRVRVECRRSSRRLPSLLPTIPDLGDDLKEGLPPIAEVEDSSLEIRPPVVVSVRAPVSPSMVVGEGSRSDGREDEKDLGSQLVVDFPPDLDFDGSPVKEDGYGSELGDVVEGSRGVLSSDVAMDSGIPVPSPIGLRDGDADAHESMMTGEVDEALRAAPDMVSSSSSLLHLIADGGGLETGSVSGASDVLPSKLAVDCALCTELETGIGYGIQVVDGGVGGDAWTLPTELDCSCLPSVPSVPYCYLPSDDATTIDGGIVREEVRVSPTARGALRPQPTDGLWQPPSSQVEPDSERVEKDKGILGDYFVTKCGVLMMWFFVSFTTTMSVSFTLRETQTRMLKFTVDKYSV
ncbi:hypothetical protein Dimus_033553 [Dionaea muscipula]